MLKSHLLVITEEASDLLDILRKSSPTLTVIRSSEIPETDLHAFGAIAILGGVSDKPLLLAARERIAIEAEIRKGKRVFAEYMASIGHVYCESPENTRFQRLVFCSEDTTIEDLTTGMLIDDQCGMRIKPHAIACCSHSAPLLQYATVQAHDQIELDEVFFRNVSDRALWFEEPDRLLVCCFRICNFLRARFAPKDRIVSLIGFIVHWLTGESIPAGAIEFTYTTEAAGESGFSERAVKACADRAMAWFECSGMLQHEGRGAVWEGLGTEIYPDGRQRISPTKRVDCIGEAALSYFMHSLMESDGRSHAVSDRLQQYVFDYHFNKDSGHLYGMVRWTEEAWGICYQDDVARAVIPQLLKCLYTGTKTLLDETVAALRFLVNTTGTDGTRVFRTDNINLTPERMAQLREEPGKLPCAHYNGYYYAALFLAYKLTGIESFMQTGLKGMETMMTHYPYTIREQSETEEYCRLILPLSWQYWITGDPKHREWLYRVTEDLQKMKHECGAYLEWDEGYAAAMRHEPGQGESSLLTRNGDPVADLLYSNNWLPIGFMQAYFVTKDERFLSLWQETAAFLTRCQIRSANRQIDGAWARAWDVRLHDVYGSPADLGWGPWAIESGWTVAEIVSGLYMGLMKERLSAFY